MARAIWKGAISFGLVHIPVSLLPAVSTQTLDFDWLDERTMDPVGYKRINKTTGKVVTKEHIVKGMEYEKGHYVVIDDDDIKAALPEATQTIDIFAFVETGSIPWINFYKPYFLSPGRRGEKVYALLRETLLNTNRVALAHVVIRTKQHLAAVIAHEVALVVMLLRWPADVHSVASLDLNHDALKPKLTAQERNMAEQLVEQMSTDWSADDYRNTFNDHIMALVEQKASKGEIEKVQTDSDDERPSADIIDLTEMLKRSLSSRSASNSTAKRANGKTSGSKASADKTSANKTSATASSDKSASARKSSAKTAKTKAGDSEKPRKKSQGK